MYQLQSLTCSTLKFQCHSECAQQHMLYKAWIKTARLLLLLLPFAADCCLSHLTSCVIKDLSSKLSKPQCNSFLLCLLCLLQAVISHANIGTNLFPALPALLAPPTCVTCARLSKSSNADPAGTPDTPLRLKGDLQLLRVSANNYNNSSGLPTMHRFGPQEAHCSTS